MEKKIALPTYDGKLCQHFGHCDVFTIISTRSGQVIDKKEVVPPPHEPGVLPAWLHEQGVDVIIAGGMGGRAQQLFAQNNIQVVVGAALDTPDALVKEFLAGQLESGTNLCDH